MQIKNFFKVFLFILKCTFIGFGGGNALMPVIKKYAVDQEKWLTNEDFDKAIIAVNLIPGPAVIEMISYVAIVKLGKFWGTMVTLLGILPHVTITLFLFYGISKLPYRYLLVLNVGVIPALVGVIFAFSYRYLKTSFQNLTYPVWIGLFLVTLGFCLFIPSPFNIPAIPMIAVILGVFVHQFFKLKIKRNK
ncbi:chromate transporter [Mycoplasmopsis cricetuli]|uniref:chromate transporter n=1 Tax=Mycoplasmopsis cricetuli TaxID=171283 RepID=UPI00047104BE|nr:chromate transporter [Mycoplasmopsis cricetuli]